MVGNEDSVSLESLVMILSAFTGVHRRQNAVVGLDKRLSVPVAA
jgi:hypothetical protein